MAWKPFRPGAIKESLLPETTEQVNLGSNAKKWLAAFIVTLTIATFTLTGRMTTGGFVNMTGVLFVDNATSRVGIGTSSPMGKLSVEGGNVLFNGSDTNLFWFNSTSGRVGIGTRAPTEVLHVSGGDIRLQRATGSPGLEVQDSDRTWIIWSDPLLDIFSFGTGSGVTSMSINTLGNVGIGLSNPAYRLEVTDTNTQTAVNLSDVLYVAANTNRVGIGTAAPTTNLQVSDAMPIITLNETDTDIGFQLRVNAKVFGIVAQSGETRLSVSNASRNIVIGDGAVQSNLTMVAAGEGVWCCGVTDAGAMACTSGACA